MLASPAWGNGEVIVEVECIGSDEAVKSGYIILCSECDFSEKIMILNQSDLI